MLRLQSWLSSPSHPKMHNYSTIRVSILMTIQSKHGYCLGLNISCCRCLHFLLHSQLNTRVSSYTIHILVNPTNYSYQFWVWIWICFTVMFISLKGVKKMLSLSFYLGKLSNFWWRKECVWQLRRRSWQVFNYVRSSDETVGGIEAATTLILFQSCCCSYMKNKVEHFVINQSLAPEQTTCSSQWG